MVLMPMTSPRELSSGPPELPGLMAASVWMASSMGAPSAVANRADGADDAAGHGAAEAEGIADGVDLLADAELRGVGQRDRLQVGRVDLQQRQVVDLVRCRRPLALIAALVARA